MNKIEACNVNFYYGDFHALKNISLTVETNEVVAFIGPSGCGKSTFLRLFNRMNDLIPSTRLEGSIKIDGADIYDKATVPTLTNSDATSAWCSNAQTLFLKAFLRMWPMV